MVRILNIETSTEICSVSVFEVGKCVAYRESAPDRSHSKILGYFIKDIFEELNIKPGYLSAVAISSGPGSYTGLRIGVSMAKGIAYGAGIPLIAVNTLQVMGYAALQNYAEKRDDYLIIPMIDARRSEVYCAVFNQNLTKVSNTQAIILERNTFENYASKKLLICGNGAEKTKEILSLKNINYIEDIYPSAKYMGFFSEKSYNKKEFADVIWFEPFYLKNFVATTPKNKLLNLNKTKND